MSDLPEDLDLKFLPDWLKEEPSPNRYAHFEGESERRDFDRGRGGPRGDRPRRDGPDRRMPSKGAPRPGQGHDARKDRGPGRPDDRGGKRPPRREREDDRDPQRRAPRPEPVQPAPLKVEFVPEPNALAAIAKQIRKSARAYPLLGTARLFLDQPERYRVRLTALEPETMLYQIGEGPVSLDRAAVERDAFRQLKDQYYAEKIEQGEPPKGNFTNVARLKATGAFLGPTNHHGYQPALRKIYEERYARRMPFPEFQQREIQILNDQQAIEDWKEQARSSVTYETTQEPEPVVFKTLADAEAHFRKTYLPSLVKSAPALEASGPVCLASHDRAQHALLGPAWTAERAFPGSLVNRMRPVFLDAGMHFFKHRKRVLYVSPIRPQRHAAAGPVSAGIAEILKVVEAHPRIPRHDLAVKILGENLDAPELAGRKTALAADLHYLVHAGHVIEFADRTLDLPLPPKAQNEEKPEELEATAAPALETAPAPAPSAPADEPAMIVEAAEPRPEPAPGIVEAAEPEPAHIADAAEDQTPAELQVGPAAETMPPPLETSASLSADAGQPRE